MKTKAFTLIELLMTIAIVGILSAIGVASYTNFSNDAKIAVTNEKLAQLKIAIMGDSRLIAAGQYSKAGFEAHCLALPDDIRELVDIPGAGVCAAEYDPFTKQGWRGPYVDSTNVNWRTDAWGTTIEYSGPDRTLTSCGPNAACGDGDDITLAF